MQQRPENDEGAKMGRIGERPAWVRHLSLPIRALHQLGAAVILAAGLFDAFPEPSGVYLALTLLSGGLLMAGDWMQHRQLPRELVGVVTLLKILLFGAAYHGYLPAQGSVLLVFLAAAIVAHAPRKIRHRLLY
ncbi:hypothetical protein [Geoalkalibacter sp.]|uniref:hypothetical protein n=1 Tax=Geoalkalibacter sp. TaxID=3041440 RepID=UPI00272E4E66|nr:hypothetical protein [Geoalkalibacter sp.]